MNSGAMQEDKKTVWHYGNSHVCGVSRNLHLCLFFSDPAEIYSFVKMMLRILDQNSELSLFPLAVFVSQHPISKSKRGGNFQETGCFLC